MTNLSMKILKSLKDGEWISYRELSDRFHLAALPKNDMYTAELLAALCVEKKREAASPISPPPDADCTFFKITVNGINLLEEHAREKKTVRRSWFQLFTAAVAGGLCAKLLELLPTFAKWIMSLSQRN